MTLEGLQSQGAHIVGIVSLEQDAHELDRCEARIEAFAQAHGIAHHATKWMRDRDYRALLKDEWRADVVFVVGCRIIINEDVYSAPPLGMYAVHDSLIPEYRGFAPLNWAILNGESQTGVTLFAMADGMDAGDIVAQQAVPIAPHDTAPKVYEGVCSATVDVVLKVYHQLEAGEALTRTPQDYSVGSFTCSRTPNDGMIDWSWETTRIYNLVRALAFPYVGAYTFYQNRPLIIWRAEPLQDARHFVGRVAGRVVAVHREGFIDVMSGDGILRVHEVSWVDGDPVAPYTLIKSVRARLGVDVRALIERVNTLEERLAKLEARLP
jgi:methionyl-tRNA formyltransferase